MVKNLDSLRASVNILDIIEKFVPLRRSGANYFGCCPFHDEKSSSFCVSVEKNMFKCFGCGVGGDVFNFIMRLKNCEFIEAVEIIASLSNFTLEIIQDRKHDEKNRLISVLEYANSLFVKRLNNEPVVLEYLKKRNLGSFIEAYGFGFCANEELNELKKKFGIRELIACGLFSQNKDKELKCFCNYRLTIPLKDARGRIISFSARSITCKYIAIKNAAKYLNGRTSPVFDKSHFLFNLDKAMESIRFKKQVIICEGFFDVLSFAYFKKDNALCCCGTAFTLEHLKILMRLGVEICFAFDKDNAGALACIKAVELCYNNNYTNIAVIILRNEGMKDLGDLLEAKKAPSLVKMNAFKYLCKVYLHFKLPPRLRDENYQRLKNIIENLPPFEKESHYNKLSQFLPNNEIKAIQHEIKRLRSKEQNNAPFKASKMEMQILKTMALNENFRFIAFQKTSASDYARADLFKQFCVGDLTHIKEVEDYDLISEADYALFLGAFVKQGLKRAINEAIDQNNYAHVEALKLELSKM